MSRLGKYIKFIPACKDAPQKGKIVYVHPKNRFVLVEYRVQTPFGLSPPLRECLYIVQGRVGTGLDTPK